MGGGRLTELIKKYGKLALGVHVSVSAASVAGLYVAIKNNVDVESILEPVLERFHLPGLSKKEEEEERDPPQAPPPPPSAGRKRNGEVAVSAGGALALAILCNKALFPIRVPITIALTPPISRFLARRNILKNSSSSSS